MRRRFFWSMLGVAALALTVVAVIAAAITRSAAREQAQNEIQRQAVAVASLVEEAVAADGSVTTRRLLEVLRDGFQSGEEPGSGFTRLLTSAQRITGGSLVDLGWVGPDGTIRLARNPGLGSALGFDGGLLEAGEDQFRRIRLPDEPRALETVAHPIDLPGPINAFIVVGRTTDLIDWRQISRGLIFPIAVAALLSAIAARGLSRWLAVRLSGMAAAAHRLADGDLAVRVPDEGDDEVAGLAASFNIMATRLEEAQSREQDFLMSVGHDLRTPLTTIGGYAEALEDQAPDAEETKRIARVLSREVGRLRRLVEDLMLLGRLGAREFTIRPEQVAVAAHVAETAEGYRKRAQDAGIRLEVHAEGSDLVVTDPDRVAQIVSNLLENALRYTPEAGRVVVSASVSGDGIMLSVADTGPGIEQRDLPRVFERFFVARRYRGTRPEGSGLGLAIVKQLVDTLGGTITVDSELGEGTAFRVLLPPVG